MVCKGIWIGENRYEDVIYTRDFGDSSFLASRDGVMDDDDGDLVQFT